MPELVLSNTTTFFSGKIERVFKLARKLGFKYLEIIPYRWTDLAQILTLEKKYGVQVAGIHMPQWWQKPKLDLFTPLWALYLGGAVKNPALNIARGLSRIGREFYLLFHTNLAREAGSDFQRIAEQYHVVLENMPGETAHNPISVFDTNHFRYTMKKRPGLNMIDAYQTIKPEIIHISYDHLPMLHALPDEAEQDELKKMLARHKPKYIVLETNPWVSAKKGKLILEKIIEESKTLRLRSGNKKEILPELVEG